MRRFGQLPLAAIIVAGLIGSFLAVRTSVRLYVLNKVLGLPGARQRANLAPKTKTLGSSTLTDYVNLGYAIFATGTTSKSLVQSTGSSDAGLLVSNAEFQLAMLPPFTSQSAGNLPVALVKHPQTARYAQKLMVDPVAAQIEMEEAQELPLLKLAFMNRDEFLLYSTVLSEKASLRRGRNEVYSFTTPRIKGIVRVGDSPQDRRIASASIASLDGRENVGFHFHLGDSVSTDIGQVLDGILCSFQFTTGSVSNRDEVVSLISSAGIHRRDESLPSAPADGNQPLR